MGDLLTKIGIDFGDAQKNVKEFSTDITGLAEEFKTLDNQVGSKMDSIGSKFSQALDNLKSGKTTGSWNIEGGISRKIEAAIKAQFDKINVKTDGAETNLVIGKEQITKIHTAVMTKYAEAIKGRIDIKSLEPLKVDPNHLRGFRDAMSSALLEFFNESGNISLENLQVDKVKGTIAEKYKFKLTGQHVNKFNKALGEALTDMYNAGNISISSTSRAINPHLVNIKHAADDVASTLTTVLTDVKQSLDTSDKAIKTLLSHIGNYDSFSDTLSDLKTGISALNSSIKMDLSRVVEVATDGIQGALMEYTRKWSENNLPSIMKGINATPPPAAPEQEFESVAKRYKHLMGKRKLSKGKTQKSIQAELKNAEDALGNGIQLAEDAFRTQLATLTGLNTSDLASVPLPKIDKIQKQIKETIENQKAAVVDDLNKLLKILKSSDLSTLDKADYKTTLRSALGYMKTLGENVDGFATVINNLASNFSLLTTKLKTSSNLVANNATLMESNFNHVADILGKEIKLNFKGFAGNTKGEKVATTPTTKQVPLSIEDKINFLIGSNASVDDDMVKKLAGAIKKDAKPKTEKSTADAVEDIFADKTKSGKVNIDKIIIAKVNALVDAFAQQGIRLTVNEEKLPKTKDSTTTHEEVTKISTDNPAMLLDIDTSSLSTALGNLISRLTETANVLSNKIEPPPPRIKQEPQYKEVNKEIPYSTQDIVNHLLSGTKVSENKFKAVHDKAVEEISATGSPISITTLTDELNKMLSVANLKVNSAPMPPPEVITTRELIGSSTTQPIKATIEPVKLDLDIDTSPLETAIQSLVSKLKTSIEGITESLSFTGGGGLNLDEINNKISKSIENAFNGAINDVSNMGQMSAVKFDLGSIPQAMQTQIKDAVNGIIKEFPQLSEMLYSVKAADLNKDGKSITNANIAPHYGEINLDTKRFSDESTFTKASDESAQRGHFNASRKELGAVAATLTHEISGHLLNEFINNLPLVTDQTKHLNNVVDTIHSQGDDFIRQNVSGYATTNKRELFAELMTQHIASKQPGAPAASPVTEIFGKAIDAVLEPKHMAEQKANLHENSSHMAKASFGEMRKSDIIVDLLKLQAKIVYKLITNITTELSNANPSSRAKDILHAALENLSVLMIKQVADSFKGINVDSASVGFSAFNSQLLVLSNRFSSMADMLAVSVERVAQLHEFVNSFATHIPDAAPNTLPENVSINNHKSTEMPENVPTESLPTNAEIRTSIPANASTPLLDKLSKLNKYTQNRFVNILPKLIDIRTNLPDISITNELIELRQAIKDALFGMLPSVKEFIGFKQAAPTSDSENKNTNTILDDVDEDKSDETKYRYNTPIKHRAEALRKIGILTEDEAKFFERLASKRRINSGKKTQGLDGDDLEGINVTRLDPKFIKDISAFGKPAYIENPNWQDEAQFDTRTLKGYDVADKIFGSKPRHGRKDIPIPEHLQYVEPQHMPMQESPTITEEPTKEIPQATTEVHESISKLANNFLLVSSLIDALGVHKDNVLLPRIKGVEEPITKLAENFTLVHDLILQLNNQLVSSIQQGTKSEHAFTAEGSNTELELIKNNTDLALQALQALENGLNGVVNSLQGIDINNSSNSSAIRLGEEITLVQMGIAELANNLAKIDITTAPAPIDMSTVMDRLVQNLVSNLTTMTANVTGSQTFDLTPHIQKIANMSNRLIGTYIDAMTATVGNNHINASDIGKTFSIRTRDLHTRIKQQLVQAMGVNNINDLVTSMPRLEGQDGLKTFIQESMSAMISGIPASLNRIMTEQINHYRDEINNTAPPLDTDVADTPMAHFMGLISQLQVSAVSKINQMFNLQFNHTMQQIRNMPITPTSVANIGSGGGGTPPRRRRSGGGGGGNRRSASNNTASNIDVDADLGSGNSVSAITDTNYGYISDVAIASAKRNNKLMHSLMGTMRYMAAGAIMGAPMMMAHEGISQFVETDYQLAKARQNIYAKYRNSSSMSVGKDGTVTHSVQPFETLVRGAIKGADGTQDLGKLSAMASNYGIDVSAKDLGDNKTKQDVISKIRDDITDYVENGVMKPIQSLSINYGLKLADVAKMFEVGTRRYGNPYSAMAQTAAAARLVAVDSENLTPEEAAIGLESISAQWGITRPDEKSVTGETKIDKISNMLIKSAAISQSTVGGLLKAQERSAAIFRSVLPETNLNELQTTDIRSRLNDPKNAGTLDSVTKDLATQYGVSEKDVGKIGNRSLQTKEENIASSIALQSFFMNATGRSGLEAGTFFKSLMYHPLNRQAIRTARDIEGNVVRDGAGNFVKSDQERVTNSYK